MTVCIHLQCILDFDKDDQHLHPIDIKHICWGWYFV